MSNKWLKYSYIAVVLFLVVWIINNLFDYFFTYNNIRLVDIMLFRVSPGEWYFRIFLSAAVLVFAFFMIRSNLKLKKLRKEVEVEKQKYQILAENTNDVIWTMSMSGEFKYVSPSVERLRGYKPDEIIGESFEQAIAPGSIEIVRDLFKRFQEIIGSNPGKTPSVVTEIEQNCKNGSTVWTEASVTTIMDENGQPSFFLGVSRDISERRKRETELKQSEENYRLLAETSQDFILVFDLDGFITYCNPSFQSMTKYSSDELIGKEVNDLFSSKGKDIHKKYISDPHLKKQSDRPVEFEIFDNKKKAIPVEAAFANMKVNKLSIAILVTGRDITERKIAEQKNKEKEDEIKRINTDLEKIVKQRTAELEKTNKELEAFTYSVSHDLRAPLRHVKAFSKLFLNRMKKMDEKSESYFNTIVQSVDKMDRMIDDFLMFSKISRMIPENKKFDMDLLVKQVLYEFSVETEDRKIDWRLGKLGMEKSDKNLVRLIWVNLVSNALKFTADKDEAIMEIGAKAQKGKKVYFIKDNGAGFDEGYMEKLFKVFQRLHSDSEFPGTGIGLANVKKIVEILGGKIWGKSPGNEGAEFCFYLNKPSDKKQN